MARRSTARDADVVVVGGGHNGLVTACYLARAGLDVLVLEQASALGGGSRTEELLPGFRFDTHSVAHNILNMTDIPAELDLAGAGLEYREMDPFSVARFADGRAVRFHRSVAATVASLREVSPADADAYAAWMHDAMPVVRAAVSGIEAGASRRRVLRRTPGRLVASVQALARNGGPTGLAHLLLQPYGRVLQQRLASDVARAPVAAFAAHASASPQQPGSAFFALWQAVYHLYGQHHAVGGSQGLVDALARRLGSLGGRWQTSAPVVRVLRSGAGPGGAAAGPRSGEQGGPQGAVTGVELADGSRVRAPCVVTAVDPRAALLQLLDPPLTGPVAEDLRATHTGNAVQMLVHLAVDRLPAYPGGRPGDAHGLQSFVDSVAALSAGFARAEAGELPDDPVPTYCFTPSALDAGLAPPGQHTVYLACPTAPFRLRGGWEAQAEAFADRMVATVEARAPGFTASVRGRSVRTPEQMAAELRWPGAHPMYLDLSPDQLAWMRPTRSLSAHTTPVRGLFVTGAGTSPVGGIAGSPGRAAARAVLARHPVPPAS